MGLRYAVGVSATNGEALGSGVTTSAITTWTSADAFEWSFVAASKGSGDSAESFVGIKTDGTLWGWGHNASNTLGLGDSTSRSSPVQIMSGAFTHVAVAPLTPSGYAVRDDGTLWVWGANASYQLGLGDTTARSTPVQVGSGTGWAKVFVMHERAIALKTDGTLWSAGSNSSGATGQGTSVGTTNTWTQIGTDTDWARAAVGYHHALALKTNGRMYGWGYNGAGNLASLGLETLSPTVIGADTWTRIATAANNGSRAIRTSGALYVTGVDTYGELGIGSSPLDWTVVPSLTVAEVYASEYTTVVVDSAGVAYAAGRNQTTYTLGLPLNSDYSTFTAIPALNKTISFASGSVISQAVLNVIEPELVVESAAFAEAVNAIGAKVFSDSAAATDGLTDSTFTFYLDAIGLSDSLAVGANTTSALTDSAAMRDVIQQAINQIVSDSADGADSLNLGAALALVDIADAVAVQTPSYNSVMLVAELIATLEAYNGADGYDIAETGVLSDAYVARVDALFAMLEAAQAVDTNTALVHVVQVAADSADGATDITSAGSLLNALLTDSVLATIRLNIGGELFTGWVLNADTLAPSEYQFADLSFNSACKHGDRYLLAADDGIYEFTEEAGVEAVMTYIKTGKTDFGSDMRKGVTDAYMVYSASGQMLLKVITSSGGALQTNSYALLPFASDESTEPRRAPVGKGIKSRYWQFEIVGEDAGCKFDEIGMLPVVLSRRI